MSLKSIIYDPESNNLEILDQLQLPAVTKYVKVRGVEDGWKVINKMQVRGAPAIAIVGCLSLAVEMQNDKFETKKQFRQEVEGKLNYLVSSRPTAVNMKTAAEELIDLANQLSKDESVSLEDMQKKLYQNMDLRITTTKDPIPINLLAIADANYKFLMVDIGAAGRLSDSGVFKDSHLDQGFEQNLFNVSPPDENNFPYVLVADEAFPLTNYMMRPYPRRGNLDLRKKVVFNYRLSRARRVVENSFGLLVTKWRIFRKPIIASQSTLIKIVQASVCLHNFLLMQKAENYLSTDEDISDLPTTTRGLTDITRGGSNTYSKNAAAIRESFTDYFCDDGAVELAVA